MATTCPACGTAHAWVVGRDEPPAGDQVAHFLVPTRHIWDDVVHTCANQRIFCSDECVDQWLMATGHKRGYVMDLPTLWRLARHWYDGRMERGYTRRDPLTAAAYFREVGLHGNSGVSESVDQTGRAAAASSFARASTASSISGVSLPVNVFCWLTWKLPSSV